MLLSSIEGFPAWLWADPTLPVPNLRRLTVEGAITVSKPSITWINHTPLVTGMFAPDADPASMNSDITGANWRTWSAYL